MNVGVIHPSISTFRGGANSQCKRCEDAAAVSLNMEQSSLFLAKSAIEQMKRSAKRVVKSQNISHAQALDLQAQQHGYSRWSLLQRHVKKTLLVDPKTNTAPAVETMAETENTVQAIPVRNPLDKSSTPKTKPTKEPKPPKEKKPKFLSITQIGKNFALTRPKVKAMLIKKGYLDETGTLTEKAFNENVVKIKMIQDRYSTSTEPVPFYLWLEAFIKKEFDAPSELDEYCHITSRYHIEDRLVDVFKRAGKVLDIETKGKPRGMPEYEYICLSSPYGILGGVIAVAHPPIRGVMKKYESKLQPVIDGITKRLAKVNPDEAYFFKTACARIFEWAKKR